MKSKDSSQSQAELERAIVLYEQAVAIDANNPALKIRLKELQEKRAQVSSLQDRSDRPELPATSMFQKARLADLRDPEQLRQAIQVYRRMIKMDPENRAVSSTLRYYEERLKAMVKSHRSLMSKGARRARVDVL